MGKAYTSMKYFWTLKLKSSALQITERYIALMTRRGLGGIVLFDISDSKTFSTYYCTNALTIQVYALTN